MTLRVCKTLLVAAVALYYTLVVFNNVTDYESNHQFVQHVLSMDSTFPGNAGMWRAIRSPTIHTLFYIGIIAWEGVTMILCWWGAANLTRNWRASSTAFHQAKRAATLGLTLGLFLWLVAFLSIGGEWFLMWQSKTWNGEDTAGRMFLVTGLVLLFVAACDSEQQP